MPSEPSKVPYNITLIITEQCNLRCDYCFEPTKRKRTMSPQVARKAIDQLLSVDNGLEWVNIEFSGGEPMLNFGLIQQVFYHVRSRHASDPRQITFNIGTNGTILTEEMKEWLSRFPCISVGLSLDGVKEVHDKNRSGSYDQVMENISFFRGYPVPVKMTISPTTIPRFADSVMHIHDLGFDVQANVVFEDVWGSAEEKAALLETYACELAKLVDYCDTHRELEPPFLIDGGIEALLHPWDEDHKFCGSGQNMAAVDPSGAIFPCHRFAPIGCRRPSTDLSFTYTGTKPKRCASCRVRRQCHSCLAYNYETYGDIDHRTTHHCEFVKLQLRAAALFRYHTICKALAGEISVTPSELKTMADAATFIEEHVESTDEICLQPLRDRLGEYGDRQEAASPLSLA